MNHLHNAQFRPGPEGSLLYFLRSGNVRWQNPASQGHHACVMRHARKPGHAAEPCAPIWVKDRAELHLSAWMQASRRTPVKLTAALSKQDGTLVKEEQISLTVLPRRQWKYQCPRDSSGAEQLRLSLCSWLLPRRCRCATARLFWW